MRFIPLYRSIMLAHVQPIRRQIIFGELLLSDHSHEGAEASVHRTTSEIYSSEVHALGEPTHAATCNRIARDENIWFFFASAKRNDNFTAANGNDALPFISVVSSSYLRRTIAIITAYRPVCGGEKF